MSNIPNPSISQTAKKWLNGFSDQVDFYSFQAGILLYNKDHLKDMIIEPIGFHAVVTDTNGKEFNVNGEFILDGFFPNIRKFSVTCTCSDEAPFCKHSVCAICYLITYFEKEARNHQIPSIDKIDLNKCEVMVESFKRNVSPESKTVLDLPKETFWPFESSFNEAMNDIDFLLNKLLQAFKK